MIQIEQIETMLTLDPGETTGYGVWEYNERRPLKHIEHGMIAGGLQGFIDFWHERAEDIRPTSVVAESFILDGRTAFPNVTPLRIEGALAALWSGPLFYQRNVYKRHAPDDLLKRLGLWWKGAGHDRDAARHAIARMVVLEHRPTLEMLYPIPMDAAA